MSYTKLQKLLRDAEQMAILADEGVSNDEHDYGKSGELETLVETIRAARGACTTLKPRKV